MKLLRSLPVPLQIGLLACLSVFVFISCRSSESPAASDTPAWLASGQAESSSGDPEPVTGETMSAQTASQLPELGATFMAQVRRGPYTISVTEGDMLVVEASRKGKRLMTVDGAEGAVYVLKGQRTCTGAASSALTDWKCRKTGRAEQEARHNDLFGLSPVSLLLSRAGSPDTEVEVVRTESGLVVRFPEGKAMTVTTVDDSLVVETGEQTVEFKGSAEPLPSVP